MKYLIVRFAAFVLLTAASSSILALPYILG